MKVFWHYNIEFFCSFYSIILQKAQLFFFNFWGISLNNWSNSQTHGTLGRFFGRTAKLRIVLMLTWILEIIHFCIWCCLFFKFFFAFVFFYCYLLKKFFIQRCINDSFSLRKLEADCRYTLFSEKQKRIFMAHIYKTGAAINAAMNKKFSQYFCP